MSYYLPFQNKEYLLQKYIMSHHHSCRKDIHHNWIYSFQAYRRNTLRHQEHTRQFLLLFSYMENNPLWHNHSINEKQYEQALSELESGCVM